MHIRTPHHQPGRANLPAAVRSGFTLVEMLVSVTLVLMMMAMFAQVFEIASGIHVKVRGLSKNDQRTRILSTLIRSDLNRLTMRNATPFRHMEDTDRTIVDRDLANRRGYLYVSENHPASDLDDVVQFTAQADLRLGDFTDSTPFSGRSTDLAYLGLPVVFDQPDWDDGQANHASESVAAEISYFVRAGALYRRVLLLRQPHASKSDDPTLDEDRNQNGQLDQGEDVNQNGILDSGATAMTYYHGRSFWNDFDFSAHWDPVIGSVTFHGIKALDNSVSIGPYAAPPQALGIRRYRFGHSLAFNFAREYDDAGVFFGRFTHEETSHTQFQYPTMANLSPLNTEDRNGNGVLDPGVINVNGNNVTNDSWDWPGEDINGNGSLDTARQVRLDGEDTNGNGQLDPGEDTNGNGQLDPGDSVVVGFRNGPRRSEDLLMTNVHSFDVKILRASHADPGFLELYDEDFDTRHPRDSNLFASEDVNGDNFFNRGNMDGVLARGEDVNGDCELNLGNGDGFLNRGNGNGILDPSEDTNGNGVLDPGEDLNNNGQLDPSEDVNNNSILDPGEDHNEDVNGNGVLDPGEDNDEDVNNNGQLDPAEDVNLNCKLDTEDRNGNGQLDPGEDTNFNLRLDYGEDFFEDINGNNHQDTYLPHRWKPLMHVATPPTWPRLPSEDLNLNGRLDPGEDGNRNGQLDFFYNEDHNGNGVLDGNEDLNNNNALDHYVVRARNKPGTNGVWFRPIASSANATGRTGSREPVWPSRLGLAHDRRSTNDVRRRAYDGTVRWQAIPDRHRAMAIQITVRLLDPKSGQFRQVTILHPLTGK